MIEQAAALFGDDRAERIARTEALGSLNAGEDYSYRNDPEVWGEEWLSTHDERVRDTHLEADGQVIPKDGKFSVGDASLAYPGDPDAGEPGETINCRCTIMPVLIESGGVE
jgi:hypothetical protein